MPAIAISFDYLNKGARVTLTYDFEGGMDTDYPNTEVGAGTVRPVNDLFTDVDGITESETDVVSSFANAEKVPSITTLLPVRTTGGDPR